MCQTHGTRKLNTVGKSYERARKGVYKPNQDTRKLAQMCILCAYVTECIPLTINSFEHCVVLVKELVRSYQGKQGYTTDGK